MNDFNTDEFNTDNFNADDFNAVEENTGSWNTVACFLIIGLVVAYIVSGIAATPVEPLNTSMEKATLRLQAKIAVAINNAASDLDLDTNIVQHDFSAAKMGSFSARIFWILLAVELGAMEEAEKLLTDLEQDLAQASPVELERVSPEDLALLPIAKKFVLFNNPQTESQSTLLSAQDHSYLAARFDWLSKLIQHPKSDDPARTQLILEAKTLMGGLFLGIAILLMLGALGALFWMAALVGKMPSQLSKCQLPESIYLQTFTIWLVFFVALQHLIPWLPKNFQTPFLLPIVFLGSLLALLWPPLRGHSLRLFLTSSGWTLGPGSAIKRWVLTPLSGLLGYCMLLPALVMGAICTWILISVHHMMQQEITSSLFLAPGSSAHPIAQKLAEGDSTTVFALFLAACICAPIVEETVFRGVLYRYLRKASQRWAQFSSFLFATTINSLIFAAIHPQGWVAIPVLASIAFCLSFLREWRDSLLPAMIVHGLNNTLVLGVVLLIS